MEENSGNHKIETGTFGCSYIGYIIKKIKTEIDQIKEGNNGTEEFQKQLEDLQKQIDDIEKELEESITSLADSHSVLDNRIKDSFSTLYKYLPLPHDKYFGNVGPSEIKSQRIGQNPEWDFNYEIPEYDFEPDEQTYHDTLTDQTRLGPLLKQMCRILAYLTQGSSRAFDGGFNYYKAQVGNAGINSYLDDDADGWNFNYKIPAYDFDPDESTHTDTLTDQSTLGVLLKKMCRILAFLTTENDNNFHGMGFKYYRGEIGQADMNNYFGPDEGNWGFDYPIPKYEYDRTDIDEDRLTDKSTLGPLLQRMSRCISYLMDHADIHFNNGLEEYTGQIGKSTTECFLAGDDPDNWDFNYTIPAFEYDGEQVEEDQISSKMLGPLLQKICRCIAYLMKKDSTN